MVKAVGVKFKHAGKVYYFDPAGKDVEVGDKVIVETAKANGLRPFHYLNFLLERLPNGYSPEACLPWGTTAQSICR